MNDYEQMFSDTQNYIKVMVTFIIYVQNIPSPKPYEHYEKNNYPASMVNNQIMLFLIIWLQLHTQSSIVFYISDCL